MKIKVSEATNTQLDWLVAKCEGEWILSLESFVPHHSLGRMNFSTDWSQGGPLIELEGIELHGSIQDAGNCWAQFYKPRLAFDGKRKHYHRMEGPTPLIAAIRCFVVSKLGDEVEIPEELT